MRNVLVAFTLLATAPVAMAEGPSLPSVAVTVAPPEAQVGDRLATTVIVEAPAGAEVELPTIEARLGPFTVLSGAWSGPDVTDAQRQVWTWSGALAAYRTGTLTVPAVGVAGRDASGTPVAAASETISIEIRPSLAPDESGNEALADLKPPASIEPDYRPLLLALAILTLLLAGSGLFWWLHRRYAQRFAAVPGPTDPFQRQPPHVWVYAELQRLLDRRLPEQGETALFFEELARIVKLYLGGRYRVELMERTTAEVPEVLAHGGADAGATASARALLERADGVKFALASADAGACRNAVEEAYRIVDATKPRDAVLPPAARGAA